MRQIRASGLSVEATGARGKVTPTLTNSTIRITPSMLVARSQYN